MLNRRGFDESLAEYRATVGSFLDRVVVPRYPAWEARGVTPREAWLEAGSAGLLCPGVEPRFGGAGASFRHSVVIIEELARRRCTGFMTFLHSEIVVPYLSEFGSVSQRDRYLPECVTGRVLTALAMTEPAAGGDIEATQTRAERDGDSFVVRGSKVHVSCGTLANLLVVCVRSRPLSEGREGLSLLLVEPERHAGVTRTAIEKGALRALDTAKLEFDDVRVPARNLLGAEGMAFFYLMKMLAVERLVLAISAQAASVQLLRELVAHCSSRGMRTGTLLDFQNTRFALAEMLSEAELCQSFVDRCIDDHIAGELPPHATSIAKLRSTELLKKLSLLSVQLRGGQGTVTSSTASPGQDLLDACAQTVWGGASEIMKHVISQDLVRYA